MTLIYSSDKNIVFCDIYK